MSFKLSPREEQLRTSPKVSPRGSRSPISGTKGKSPTAFSGGSSPAFGRTQSFARTASMLQQEPPVQALQREMVQPTVSHASAVVKDFLSFPSLDTDDSDDPLELRQQMLILKAKMNEFRNKAEQACYEVERRHRAENNKQQTRSPTGAVVTGKVVAPKPMLKQAFGIDSPSSESSPIPLLDAVQNLVTAGENEEGWDLLKDDVKRRGTHTTVGIRLGHNSSAHDLRPLQIQIVIPGSAAHICGVLNRGDEIVAVDGKKVSEDDMPGAVSAVRGVDIVGTSVAVTFKQNNTGKEMKVDLVRGAWGAVERKEKLFILFEEVMKLVKKEAPYDDIMKACSKMVDQAKDNEKYRSISEMKIQMRLKALQNEMHRLLGDAKKRCEMLMASHGKAVQALNTQLPELTVSLHERVEAYIKDLQSELADSERENEALQAKLEAAAKWMEAVKGMEALAAFSRRKIKNFEKIHLQKEQQGEDGETKLKTVTVAAF
mmetsp:Transcript_33170/g.68460  ORF Transcript_33170/g.68460 Transcript_33170/m.68460 type:complete len:487 (-) Transcript_33170:232-1692(-)|eukprot:CAMPEP_0181301814 /NCGR_PEP_ID=MMETSP1101-20121128/7631_1 /TAXON_ID=46948 /ORGANISM="Rhodomonas abbreviata, Strain Caron Lab Isolate" /LENGTH=486 /DNA_ID=CAMNT_0023407157 /DNA_START=115 /DNA_END=1575 /DNA_ORIENTATION=+